MRTYELEDSEGQRSWVVTLDEAGFVDKKGFRVVPNSEWRIPQDVQTLIFRDYVAQETDVE